MLKKYCKTSTETADLFVGIRFIEGVPEVVFPHGYHLVDEDKECRKDILINRGYLSKLIAWVSFLL